MATFFPDENTYRRWASRIPTVTMLPEEPDRCNDPHEYGESNVELPHFYSPDLLLFRPNSQREGVVEPFYAICRVDGPQEADCCWYVPEEGTVYAAYVWDASGGQKRRVGGQTPGQARAALCAYLKAHSPSGKQTRVISS